MRHAALVLAVAVVGTVAQNVADFESTASAEFEPLMEIFQEPIVVTHGRELPTPSPEDKDAITVSMAVSQYEYCQAIRYREALLWPYYVSPNLFREGDLAERKSTEKMVVTLKAKMDELKSKHNVTDMQMLRVGLRSSFEEDFIKSCWPSWHMESQRLVLIADPDYSQFDQLDISFNRRISAVEREIQFLREGPRHSEEDSQREYKLPRLEDKLKALRQTERALLWLQALNVRSIYVRTAIDRLMKVVIFPNDTVEDLKREIELRDGIPMPSQLLVFDGKELEDDAELLVDDLHIPLEGVVHLIRRVTSYDIRPALSGDNAIAEQRINEHTRPALDPHCIRDHPYKSKGCFLSLPFKYDRSMYPEIPMEPYTLMLNLTPGAEPGSLLINDVALDQPGTTFTANILRAKESPLRAADAMVNPDGRMTYPQATITRWTARRVESEEVRESDPRLGAHALGYDKNLKYVLTIEEVDGKPVDLANIALEYNGSNHPRAFFFINAVWTYYDLPDFDFPSARFW